MPFQLARARAGVTFFSLPVTVHLDGANAVGPHFSQFKIQPPTAMPLDFEPKEIVPHDEISVTLNTDMIAGMQASESYSVRAKDGHVLGEGGETRAFGKYGFDRKTASETVAKDFANSSGPLFDNSARDYMNEPRHGGDRNLLTRAVASSQLDKHLGLNTLAEEKFGLVDGRLIGISVQVDGAGLTGKFDTDQNGVQVEAHAFLAITPADTGHAASPALQNSGLPDHLKGYADPRIQKGLSDLEVMDYVSGQIDRHPGNVFVDPQNGKVKGIDNDLAFPEIDRADVLRSDVALRQKMVQTMPMMIHQDTARKLAAADPEAVRQMLGNITRPDGKPGLSAAEIDGAVARLQEIQQAIADPAAVPGFQVVQEFNDQTFLQAVDQQKATFQIQQDNMARKYGNPVGAKTFDNMVSKDLEDAYRSSYLGAVVMAEKQKSLEIAVRPDGNTMRPANTVTAARRDPQFVEFNNQVEAAKKNFKFKPDLIADTQLGQQVSDLQKEIADVKTKIAHYENETAKLDDHKAGALIRSLASGGVAGRKEFYADKKNDASQRLQEMESQLDELVSQAITDDMKADIYADAGIVVANQRTAQNVAPPEQVQNVAPPIEQRVPLNQLPPPVSKVGGAGNGVPPIEQRVPLNQLPPPVDVENSQVENVSISAAKKEAGGGIKSAEDEQDVADLDALDDLDDNPSVEMEEKVTSDLQRKPSVAEMLKRTQSSPALGGHRQGHDQAQGQDGQKPKPNSLRASGDWQPAKPSAPKLGGSSLTRYQ